MLTPPGGKPKAWATHASATSARTAQQRGLWCDATRIGVVVEARANMHALPSVAYNLGSPADGVITQTGDDERAEFAETTSEVRTWWP
jgi:hypothetical protein